MHSTIVAFKPLRVTYDGTEYCNKLQPEHIVSQVGEFIGEVVCSRKSRRKQFRGQPDTVAIPEKPKVYGQRLKLGDRVFLNPAEHILHRTGGSGSSRRYDSLVYNRSILGFESRNSEVLEVIPAVTFGAIGIVTGEGLSGVRKKNRTRSRIPIVETAGTKIGQNNSLIVT